MRWYLEVLKKYAVFSGRASRTEYWTFTVCNCVVSLGVALIDGVVGRQSAFGNAQAGVGLSLFYLLAIFIPSIAVTVRRFHDIDRTGWWMLFSVVPLANVITMVFLLQDGTSGTNRFGDDPRPLDSLQLAL